jgi:hypothetical protein
MTHERAAVSTTFAAIILVVAIIVASVGALETIRLNSSATHTNGGLTSISLFTSSSTSSNSGPSYSSSSTSVASTSSSSIMSNQPTTTTTITSSTSCDNQLGNVSPAGSIAANESGGFNITSSGFIVIEPYNAQNGVEIVYVNSSLVTDTWIGNLSLTFPNGTTIMTNGSQPYNPYVGASEDGHIFGGLELSVPVGPSYVPFTPFFTNGTYYMNASLENTANITQQFSVNGSFVVSCTVTSSYTTSASSQGSGFVIMFRSINSSYAWGLNITSFGGYVGGLAYNPQCFNCTPYNASDPNGIMYGYEYPWYDYATYPTPWLGVYSSEPFVNVISFQYTVAYPGPGNHMVVNPNQSMTLEVTAYQVPLSTQNEGGIYTFLPPDAVPYSQSYVTIYPNTTFCGDFQVPSSNSYVVCPS